MAEMDMITDRRVLELLQTAQEQKALLTMELPKHEFEGLTVITDISRVRLRWVINIDPPKGLGPLAEDLAAHTFRFRFRGPDMVEYVFHVSGGVVDGPTLRFPLPEALERRQRRSDFRMETPSGTRLKLTRGDQQGVLELINISISGTLGALARPVRSGSDSLVLKVGDTLTELHILLPEDEGGEPRQIGIRQAVVRRIERETERNILRYAMEFLKMTPADERKLVQFVYELQRRFLRNPAPSR